MTDPHERSFIALALRDLLETVLIAGPILALFLWYRDASFGPNEWIIIALLVIAASAARAAFSMRKNSR